MSGTASRQLRKTSTAVPGQCVCGSVRLEIDYPAFWAWHDHSRATQQAHGAPYATYVGVWKSRFRFVLGDDRVIRFEDKARRTARSFCATCGTPLLFERSHSPQMVNVPRALFEQRTGREPATTSPSKKPGMGLSGRATWAIERFSRGRLGTAA